MKLIEKNFRQDDVIKNYKIFFPSEKVEKGLPMIVFLHGGGERGEEPDETDRINAHGIPKYLHEGTMQLPAIVFCPQCPYRFHWENLVVQTVSLINAVAEKYGVDRKRISITGLSMGGCGTFATVISFPEIFSAAATVCGGGRPRMAYRMKDVPLWSLHGDADTTILPERSVEMVNAIKEAGGNPTLTMFPGVKHGSWNNAYLGTRVIEWLLEQKNER